MTILTFIILFFLLLGFPFSTYFYRGHEKTIATKIAKIANKIAWGLFISVITFYIIYGYFYPFRYDTSARPQEYLLDWVPLTSQIIFVCLAWVGTAFVKNKINNIIFCTLVRLILTIIHCMLAFGLFILLLISTCGFHATECCC